MSRAVVTSVGVAVVPDGHDPQCLCPSCLMADLDAHLVGIGIDPAPYAWYDVPAADRGDGVKRQRLAPGVPFTPVKQRRSRHGRAASNTGRGQASPLAGLSVEDLPTPQIPDRDRVQVRVEDIGAGAWVRVTGWPADLGDDAAELTVSGAVVAGPDQVRVWRRLPDHGPTPGETVTQRIRREWASSFQVDAYAVEVRDYRGGPDQVLYVPTDGYVELVNDQTDQNAQVAHALNPVFGDGAELVYLAHRRTRGDGMPRRNDRWQTLDHLDVSAEQLAAWERGGAYTRLSAVHHRHRPVSGGTR